MIPNGYIFLKLTLAAHLLAGCFPVSQVALDEIDVPVYADEGVADETVEGLRQAELIAQGSPIYQAQTGRFEGTAVLMPGRALSELRDFGTDLTAAAPRDVPAGTDLRTLAFLARTQNLRVAQAAEGVRRADIERDNAGMALSPRIGGDIDFGRVEERIGRSGGLGGAEGNFDRTILRVEAVQPIYDAAALAARDAADRAQGVARAAFAAEAQAAVFEVTDTYLRGMTAKARRDLTEKRLGRVRDQLSAEGRLRAAGRSVAAAALVLDVERGAAEGDIALFDQELDTALADLARLTGRPVTDIEVIRASASAYELPGPVTGYLAEALEANPLMQQRRLETVRRRDLYREAVARDFAPRVEGYARADYEGESGSASRIGTDTEEYAVGVRISVPIYNRTGTGYAHRVAESAYRDATLSEVALRRQLEAEIVTLIARVDQGLRALSGAERALAAAQALVRSERAAVASGVAAPVAVLAREIQLIRAEESLLLRRYEILRARARLAFLTGNDPVEVLI
ncbi:TolC family protein [Pontivivens nitratireducens]|uniref:TolC family protein n=1 Tax=Pontivivens nitratireducens TaxID=2758038 RepID=UPI001639D470|nr:TolC family protein [Pontibrevibacter nitratireducens]